MKTKSILITFIMATLFAYLVYAVVGTVTLTTPADDSYNPSDNEVDFVCNGTGNSNSPGYNISSVDLFTDNGGTWAKIFTDTTNYLNGSDGGASFSHSTLIYGTTVKWNCRVNYTFANDSSQITLDYALSNKSIRVPYIGEAVLTQPADNFYNTNDTIHHIVNGTGVWGYNITSITLWSNVTGTWAKTYVNDTERQGGAASGFNYSIPSIADGTHYVWNAMINYSKNVSTSNLNRSFTYATANKTVFVEYPPVITLNYPVDSGYVAGEDVFNFTSLAAFSEGYTYTNCIIYTNLSTWTTYGPTIQAINNTQMSTTLALSDATYKWNVKCWEPDNSQVFGFASANNTFTIDSTVPVLSVPFTNGTWSNAESNILNITMTDLNADSCDFWMNNTGSPLSINQTNASTTGISIGVTNNYSDGNYTFYWACNDTAGNWVNTSEYQLRVDTFTPTFISIVNSSRADYCDEWNITVTSNEDVNMTISYGLTTATGTEVFESDYTGIQSEFISPQAEDTLYYFNTSICDRAGNCNNTRSEAADTYRFPFKICSGWTYLGIYEARINMSEIIRQSKADYVYSWNQSNQEWFYYLGSGAGGSQKLSYGDEAILYEAGNTTWTQNRTGTGFYDYEIRKGDNYIPLTREITFGGLSTALMNVSDSWGVAHTELNSTNYNFTWFDAWNNSALDWLGGYTYDNAYNWTWNNVSVIGNGTGTEVVWFYSDYNLSATYYTADVTKWNGSSITWYNGSEWR